MVRKDREMVNHEGDGGIDLTELALFSTLENEPPRSVTTVSPAESARELAMEA